jgi:hypothetical protein
LERCAFWLSKDRPSKFGIGVVTDVTSFVKESELE